jgi:hypothetical protein
MVPPADPINSRRVSFLDIFIANSEFGCFSNQPFFTLYAYGLGFPSPHLDIPGLARGLRVKTDG